MKHLISVLLFLVLTLCIGSNAVYAENEIQFEKDGIRYQVMPDQTQVIMIPKAEKYEGNIKIPPVVRDDENKEYIVRHISPFTFKNCENLLSVEIPNTITNIWEGTFFLCKNLSKVTIPASVLSIEKRAFLDCVHLKDCVLPPSLCKIGKFAFCNCQSLEEVTIPEGVTSLSEKAFCGCTNLTSVSLPHSLLKIKSRAFERCKCLKYIILPEQLTHIGSYAFYHCYSLNPIIFLGDHAPEIEKYAFYFPPCFSDIEVSIQIPQAPKKEFEKIMRKVSGYCQLTFL